MSLPRATGTPGPLADHVREGRVFRSPIAATGVLQIGDWARDDFPDLPWPFLVLSELGTDQTIRFVRWQKAVQTDLSGKADVDFVAECLDGRLTSLDKLVSKYIEAKAIIIVQAHRQGLLPDATRRAIALYPRRPAAWLTSDEVESPTSETAALLAQAALHAFTDRHREAVVKCLPIWSAIQAGTLKISPDTAELLKLYPSDAATRAMTDSTVRAMWGASKSRLTYADTNHFDESIKWARIFWGTNSMITRCVRRRDADTNNADLDSNGTRSAEAAPSNPAPESPKSAAVESARLRQLAMDLFSSYVEATETSPARLYDREQQEVISGLVASAGRELITALGAPDLWCLEHGSHIIRTFVEARIYIQWMATQEPSIYRTFQEYGAGKAKLYARILDELPGEARRPDFEEAIAEFETLSHNNDILDHRVVDTRDSFAGGKSIRKMAEDCGLLDLYRQAYSVASGVSHSEWWSLEAHVMERCGNVLHGGHQIVSLSLNPGENVELAQSWIDQFHKLIRVSLEILVTDHDAIETAFAWTSAEQETTGKGPEKDSSKTEEE